MTTGHIGSILSLKMIGDQSLPTLISCSSAGQIKNWNITSNSIAPLETNQIVNNDNNLLFTCSAMRDEKTIFFGVEPNIINQVSLVKKTSKEDVLLYIYLE